MHINSVNDASISCKNFVKFGLVIPELTELIFCERQVQHGQKTRVFSRISPVYTGLIFAICSPYESVLGADDDLYFIFRFVKGRCHGNQIMLGETRK